MTSKYIIGGIIIGGNTIRMNGLGMQIDGDEPFATLPGATVRDANEKGDLPPMSAAPVTPAGAAIAAQQGYVSEHGQAAAIHPRQDAQGRLIDGVTGKVITEPENTDPVPQSFDDLQAAQQWFQDHPYYHHQLVVDGNPYSTGWADSPARFSTRTGKITYEASYTVPAPVPVTVLPIPSSGDFDVNVNIGAKRQEKFRTNKLGSGTVRYHLTAPNIPNPTSPGQVDFAEVSGSATHNSEIVVTNAAGKELFRATAIDPSVSWSTAPGPGVDVVIPPGSLSTWAFRHVDAISTTEGNDVWSQWRNPA
jgi:hypothetical protein